MRGKIFISYRRDDTRADARSIYERLQRTFGADQLFMDVDSIPRGSDFRVLLDRYLRQCQVMLVLIGQHWLGSADERGQRRIDDASDFVRLELAMALKRRVAVIPVLLDGARLPRQSDLPGDLKALVFRQAASVRHETFARDMDVLEKDIRLAMRSGARPLATAAVLAALALAGAGAWLWPQISTRLALANAGSDAGTTTPSAAFGTPSPSIAAWQKEVRPVAFKVEESPAIGRSNTLAQRLKTLSKGQIDLQFEAPKPGTRPFDRLDALSRGTIDGVWEQPAYWARLSTTLVLYSGQVPLGLDTRRLARFVQERGTRELNALYQGRLGLRVTALPCNLNPPEGFWLKRPVGSAADLNGLSIRTGEFFLARLAPKLGVKPLELPSREFVAALQKGALDGGEFSNPQSDYELGLGKSGASYYYPGFHSPARINWLHFNLDRWTLLDASTRGLIEEACRAQLEDDLRSSHQRSEAALVRLKSQGVEVRAFPAEVLAAVERAVRQLVEEIAAKEPEFRPAWAAYNAYR